MKINYVQRPCLGINQSSLFIASDDMAQNASSRSEFLLNPDTYLAKYDVRITQPRINDLQKTSEICTLIICVVSVAVVAAAVVAVVSVLAASSVTHVSVYNEVVGMDMNKNNTIAGNSYIGIV